MNNINTNTQTLTSLTGGKNIARWILQVLTAAAFLIAGLANCPVSRFWLKFFSYCPAEWIWRRLAYRRQMTLRIESFSDNDFAPKTVSDNARRVKEYEDRINKLIEKKAFLKKGEINNVKN